MTDAVEKKEADRLKRILTRDVIKRTTTVSKIRSINELAKRAVTDPSMVKEAVIAIKTLDSLWAKFEHEDEEVLDGMIQTGTEAEYSPDLPAEVLSLINAAKAFGFDGAKNDYFSGQPVQEPSEQSVGEPRSSKPFSRLPDIPLPSFKGDFSYWPTFRDRFSALVHDREDISDIDKMYYLIGCLHGPAADSIRSINVSAENYNLAWSTLASRFHRPRLVATSLIDKLLHAPVSTNETLSDLNTFIATFEENIALLQALKIPDLGSFIIFSVAFRCLPSSTRKLFESAVSPDFPSVSDLLTFVQSRVAVLEIAGDPRKPVNQFKLNIQSSSIGRNKNSKLQPTSLMISKPVNDKSGSCNCCKADHPLTSCRTFESWPFEERSRWARKNKLCYICLSDKHWANKCRSRTKCTMCHKRHHTLLHDPDQRPPDSLANRGEASLCTSTLPSKSKQSLGVLLGTALVHICDRSGTWQTARALIDSASQISAITESCAKRLSLRPTNWTAPLSGLADTPVHKVKGMVNCKIQPRFASEPQLNVQAWVLPSITSSLPRQSLPETVKRVYDDLALADPSFNVTAPVDILFGADWFSTILDGRKLVIGEKLPSAFSTIFGWVLIGSVDQPTIDYPRCCPVSLTVSVECLMEKFWRVEEPEVAPLTFTEDGRCEVIYQNEHQRMASGRFAVPLLCRTSMSETRFPGSREHAIRRFEGLEKRLSTDAKLKSLYSKFMSEYISLGHMSVAESPGLYFVPHHAVYRPEDGDDKIRVVFDASAKCAKGLSLNDCLMHGPKLQQDIVDVLTRFRVPRFVFTADICKMYRQILILPKYRPLQHIFWRDSPLEKLIEYELNTVTYGVNCAPFLALRVLQSIASEECPSSSAVRDALTKQTYVDDVCTGADSIDDVLKLQKELITTLGRAELELKKWSSNESTVLETIPEDHRVICPRQFTAEDDLSTKVLGLQWHPTDDYFRCALRLGDSIADTKRGLLSLIARIFDPLGLFAPSTFYGKCIMQRTWLAKVGWDDPLPTDILQDWSLFVSELPLLLDVKVPRYLNTRLGSPCLLLGFCDASQLGYAAVVYIKVLSSDATRSTFLLGTKTKLAPIKQLTIPRLELNAALLLAKWMSRLRQILESHLNIVDVYAWTDSAIVLSWLTNPHETFKVYVSNRAHQIATLVSGCRWSHIRSEDNPADSASRGVLPSALSKLSLYWNGPDIVHESPERWSVNIPSIPVCDLPETRPVSLVVQSEVLVEWFHTFSVFDRLVRIVALVYQFINKCRKRPGLGDPPLSVRDEHNLAVRALVFASQQCHFSRLLDELKSGRRVTSKPLSRLCPFIDPTGIIRVGGRLRHSTLDYDVKHPMLLAKSSHLAMMICRRWHHFTCHAGTRVVSSLIYRQYWIMSIKSVLHKISRTCPVCVRFDGRPPQPQMADLPPSRVQQCRPFSRVGVDFAGPLNMREVQLRKSRTYKVYIAVFICFVVKAVHLEVVTNLSTEAFLAAFDRFIARRGLPSEVFSDCGTNFIGADRQLQRLINSEDAQKVIPASQPHCQWNFNPPSAPHFGGLWEAAVRSTKRLLIRTMGTHTFSYEELTTVLTRIEAVLNSRPLTPLSNNPHDLDYLSPGHFLVGQPLLSLPPRVPFDSTINLTQRWKLLDLCHQAFWRRWSSEYLTSLQERSKWVSSSPNINVNDLVIIVDNQAPPLTWRRGRILEVLPGKDGVVRVARVLTQQGQLLRPVTKLVVLPAQ